MSFVDTAHGWAVGNSGTILAYTNPPASGTMTASPSSGPPGTVISAYSSTPCPTGSTFVRIYLVTTSGVLVASNQAGSFSSAGNWSGAVTVPAATPAGSYFVTARCFGTSTKDETQDYNFVPFSVTSGGGTGTGTLTGHVYKGGTGSTTPLSGATVTVDGSKTRTTGSTGAYSYSLAAGGHTIQATFPGRTCHMNSGTGPVTPPAQPVTVTAGGTTTVNFYCKL